MIDLDESRESAASSRSSWWAWTLLSVGFFVALVVGGVLAVSMIGPTSNASAASPIGVSGADVHVGMSTDALRPGLRFDGSGGKTFGTAPLAADGASLTPDEESARMPDFIAVTSRDGTSVAGFISKDAIGFGFVALGQTRPVSAPVVGDDLSTEVGAFCFGKGFVAPGEDPDALPTLMSASSR